MVTARDLRDAITFRLQWRWRIPAAAQLAAASPELARLTTAQLGILAGHLHRTRCRGQIPATLARSYGIVRTGTITATATTGGTAQLSPGSTWNPARQPRHAPHRAVLIHIDTATLHQLANWTPTGFVDTIRSGTMVYEERTGSGTGSQEVHPGV